MEAKIAQYYLSGFSMKWTSGQNSNKKNTSLWATITTLATRIKWWIGKNMGILVKFFVTEVCTRLQNGTVAGLPAPVQKIADKPGAQKLIKKVASVCDIIPKTNDLHDQ